MPMLKCDIETGRRGVIYGKAGDQVKIISDCGAVTIVEGSHGRFPVRTDLLTDEIETVVKSSAQIVDAPLAKKNKGSKSKPVQKDLF